MHYEGVYCIQNFILNTGDVMEGNLLYNFIMPVVKHAQHVADGLTALTQPHASSLAHNINNSRPMHCTWPN